MLISNNSSLQSPLVNPFDVTAGIEPITLGTLEVRLAQNTQEIDASQELRYRVFVGEIGAKPTEENKILARDIDKYDAVCDHLLVIEHDAGKSKVVGSYRLLRSEPMKQIGNFYTASEYDIHAMLSFEGNVLEVGRSCVDEAYRNRAVMQLLWRGIASYIEKHRIDLMFGCGSLYGASIEKHKETLSYLYHYHLAPEHLRNVALSGRYESMNLVEKETILHPARIFAGLPPLIKGYLRLGGYVGDGAVLDYEYNTTDVAIVVKTQNVTGKYIDRYASEKLKETIQGDGA